MFQPERRNRTRFRKWPQAYKLKDFQHFLKERNHALPPATHERGESSGLAGATNNGLNLESEQVTVVEISDPDHAAAVTPISFSISAPADAKIISDFLNVRYAQAIIIFEFTFLLGSPPVPL